MHAVKCLSGQSKVPFLAHIIGTVIGQLNGGIKIEMKMDTISINVNIIYNFNIVFLL